MSDWYIGYWSEPWRHTPELDALAVARLDAGMALCESTAYADSESRRLQAQQTPEKWYGSAVDRARSYIKEEIVSGQGALQS